jgi:hypothetical protein
MERQIERWRDGLRGGEERVIIERDRARDVLKS